MKYFDFIKGFEDLGRTSKIVNIALELMAGLQEEFILHDGFQLLTIKLQKQYFKNAYDWYFRELFAMVSFQNLLYVIKELGNNQNGLNTLVIFLCVRKKSVLFNIIKI